MDNTCTNRGKAAILRGKAEILTRGLRDSYGAGGPFLEGAPGILRRRGVAFLAGGPGILRNGLINDPTNSYSDPQRICLWVVK